jgi:hypothetical protein
MVQSGILNGFFLGCPKQNEKERLVRSPTGGGPKLKTTPKFPNAPNNN